MSTAELVQDKDDATAYRVEFIDDDGSVEVAIFSGPDVLIALLKKIPPSGSAWPGAQRVRWFRTFAMNVSQIYDTDEPVEMKIELEGQP